jgi:hypothetical protein
MSIILKIKINGVKKVINDVVLNRVFNPNFYLLWNGLSKRAGKRHSIISSAELEAERITNIGCKNVFILRPCYLYSCIKTGSKRLIYSKMLNETEYENTFNLWFVWSKDRKTVKKYFSLKTAQVMAKKCSIMYKQKYIIMRCVEIVGK